jgi:hypothetical protein
MMFLLGRHATFGHAPPTYFRSIEAVRLPSLAIVQAINLPAVPLPSTRTSYLSGSLMLFISFLSSTTWDKKLFAAINLSDGGAEVWSFCRELAKAKSI